MDSTTDANYLSNLIDKSTVVNENGVLKVKKLDGQEVTITEINYLKGLTMNVMDLVNAFANGGVKVLNTPLNTASELDTMDRTSFTDGISYIVYVLADETHSNAKTTYLCTKTSTTFFGNADSQRNFTTNPIDLANEVTGKLGTSNIDVDSLWTLLTINDTYKTLTTNNEIFGTHGAKAMYDELTTAIGEKANTTDLTTHTGNADIHVTTTDKTKWDKVIDKVDTTDFDALKTKVEEKIGNIGNLKLIDLGENADADNCRIEDRDINGVYGYCGLFTQNVPMEGYAEIRCYHYGGGIRQFIDYTARTNTKTYTRFIQYNGNLPTAWQELATMDKVADITNSELTNMNTKLAQLETKTASSILKFPYWNGDTDTYLQIPAPTTLSKQSAFITITSSQGGCIVLLAGDSNIAHDYEYSLTKCIRLSHDNIWSHDAADAGEEKLLNVYVDKSNGYIYVKLGAYGSVSIMGINEQPVGVTTLPTGVVEEIPIVDLTKVCTTSVADIPNTVIVSENTKVKLNSNCYYTVINGVCYVTLWGVICTESGKHVVNSSMPKTRLTMKGVCNYGSNGSYGYGGSAYIYYDGNGNNKLYIEVKSAEPLYGSFSYPVAE